MVDGSSAGAQSGIRADGFVNEAFGAVDGFEHWQAASEKGRDGGGVGAAGTVRVPGFEADGAKFREAAVVKEKIYGVVCEVAAFDEDGLRAELRDS